MTGLVQAIIDMKIKVYEMPTLYPSNVLRNSKFYDLKIPNNSDSLAAPGWNWCSMRTIEG